MTGHCDISIGDDRRPFSFGTIHPDSVRTGSGAAGDPLGAGALYSLNFGLEASNPWL